MESLGPAEYRGEAITQEQVDKFLAATHSEFAKGIPPTFLTKYCGAEYELLNRLNVNWQYLLHGDQEYEYKEPVQIGVEPFVRAKVLEVKERKRKTETMRFIKLEAEIFQSDRLVAICRSTFVIREPLTEAAS